MDEAVVEMVKSRWTPGLNTGLDVDCLRLFTIIFRCRAKVSGTYDALDYIEKDDVNSFVIFSPREGQLTF
ncbi:hypothetical protein BT96DRAFT_996839 [Gymnopus androsaceus JB14]|uniref:Uncharacterized protein n=1 Tax=Gymnopus androsaceus JB14 TaxID=1447944 RepID=A0A6A4HDB6_9AGAR|nr:hypothetical protein BT96DRAFT_996839 [Gymnopus androsaceus JB14]